MKVLSVLFLALVTNVAIASSWLPGSKRAYDNWHETELERWLSDNEIPYPTPADRKDLEQLVEKHWDVAITPYKHWDNEKLGHYLKQKGVETKEGAESTKDSLLSQVASSWYETEDKAQHAWSNVKDWVLDTWTDSQLKAFADKHGIPVPQPRKRDTLLQKIRESYDNISKKAGDAAAYPGNWLYESWTESDLKEWLDTHGVAAPQPTSRDKLIASVRRNSRLAYLKSQAQAQSASASANAAYATLTDKIIDAWGESQLKEFCDKNGINVPQGTKTNQLRALVRKHRGEILGDSLSATAASAKASVASAYGAATSNVADQYTKATDTATLAAQQAFDQAVGTWSDSRLKSFLDYRGVPVPHGTKTDELRALARKNAHKAANPNTAWTWDDLSYDNLKTYLANSGNAAGKKVADNAGATRDELLSAAQSAYASASGAGGGAYASATSYLTSATDAAKANMFDTWSESDLKDYLESYGVPVPQGSKLDELRAYAKKQYTFYKYGTNGPASTAFAKLSENLKGGYQWVASQLGVGAKAAQDKAKKVKEEL